MNSWKSTVLSACLPPLRMFIIGTGSTRGVRPADVAVQRQAERVRGGVGGGHRHAEDGVRAELALVRRAVEVEHLAVDRRPGRTRSCRSSAGAIASRTFATAVERALAEVALLVAVAQFDRLVRAGAGPARHRGPADRAAARMTSTSTVGLPRLSRISRAFKREWCSLCWCFVWVIRVFRVDGIWRGRDWSSDSKVRTWRQVHYNQIGFWGFSAAELFYRRCERKYSIAAL